MYSLFAFLLISWPLKSVIDSVKTSPIDDVILLLVVCGVLFCVSLAFVVPGLAISVRRLHDLYKSGWWILINLIPIVGAIWFLVLMCQKGRTVNQKVTSNAIDIILIIVSIFVNLIIQMYGFSF
jgi:uncharacterized membrane protein YhaH (DUF805 family)